MNYSPGDGLEVDARPFWANLVSFPRKISFVGLRPQDQSTKVASLKRPLYSKLSHLLADCWDNTPHWSCLRHQLQEAALHMQCKCSADHTPHYHAKNNVSEKLQGPLAGRWKTGVLWR